MGKGIKLSFDEQEYIRQNRLNKTIPEIAKDLGRNYGTVQGYLATNNLSFKRVAIKNDHDLSLKEKEVLNLIAKGYSNKDIAKKMIIELSTVRTHLYNIYSKLNLSNSATESGTLRVKATLYALQNKSECNGCKYKITLNDLLRKFNDASLLIESEQE